MRTTRNFGTENMDDFFNRSIGFDRFFDTFNRNTKAVAENFPHYNLKKIDDNKYVIEMAVAGFAYGDLSFANIDFESPFLSPERIS